jgi:PadR family transcriptional regulator PadR
MTGLPRVTAATLDVLEVLLGPDDELYGLKIAKASGRPTGSVFPILARLEQLGWAVSAWEDGSAGDRGPRRRFYRLSPDGLAGARALLAERRGGRAIERSGTWRIGRPGTEGAR